VVTLISTTFYYGDCFLFGSVFIKKITNLKIKKKTKSVQTDWFRFCFQNKNQFKLGWLGFFWFFWFGFDSVWFFLFQAYKTEPVCFFKILIGFFYCLVFSVIFLDFFDLIGFSIFFSPNFLLLIYQVSWELIQFCLCRSLEPKKTKGWSIILGKGPCNLNNFLACHNYDEDLICLNSNFLLQVSA